jgi:transcriptional regulator with XRE-family HTH domain
VESPSEAFPGRVIYAPRERAHRLVKKLHLLMRANRVSRLALCRKAGVAPSTMKDWWLGKTSPQLLMIESCFQVLGYRLDIRESETES